jgi:hypothetical protein
MVQRIFGLVLVAGLVFGVEGFAAPVKKTKKSQVERSTLQQSSPLRRNDGASFSEESAASALKGLVVRPTFAHYFTNPTKLNNRLVELSPNDNGIKVGSGSGFGLAAEYPVIENFLVGLRLETFSASSNVVSLNNTRTTLESSVSAFPIMATGTYLMPITPKFSLGFTGGAGWAFGFSGATEISNSTNTQALPNGTLNYGATPFSGLASLSGIYSFTENFGFRVEAGYRLMSSSQLRATETWGRGENTIKEGELLRDADGKSIQVNMNSFFTGASLVITL